MPVVTRISRLALVGGLLAAALLGAASCKKQPFAQTVEQTPYLGLPGGLDDLQNIDIARLREREDFMAGVENLEEKLKIKPALDGLRERAGIDLWKDIDLLVVGSRPSADPASRFKNTIFLARGRFAQPAAKLEKARAWLAEEYLVEPPPFKETTQPDLGYKKFQLSGQSQFNVKQVYELNFAFPSETLMIFSLSAPALDEALCVIGGQTPGIQKDQAWMKMLERSDIGAMIWGAGNMDPNTSTKLAVLFPAADALRNARQYYYAVDLNQEVRVSASLACESIELATTLSQGLKTGLDQLKAMLGRVAAQTPQTLKLLDKLLINTELETSKITLNLSDEERKVLTDEWEALRKKAETPAPAAATPVPPAH